jgi:hypothetical protein
LKKSPEHYVDNSKFLTALKEFRTQSEAAKLKKKPLPAVSEYIGECFLKIATHLSYKPNFVNYTYRDDMISDGIENCLLYVHNFDPSKSSNPFGYFTQIIYYAFIRRIQREKKHTYIKYKMIEQSVIAGGSHSGPSDGATANVDGGLLAFDNVKDFINRYDTYTSNRRERRRQAKQAKS